MVVCNAQEHFNHMFASTVQDNVKKTTLVAQRRWLKIEDKQLYCTIQFQLNV